MRSYAEKAAPEIFQGCIFHVDLANIARPIIDTQLYTDGNEPISRLHHEYDMKMRWFIGGLKQLGCTDIRFYLDGGYPAFKVEELNSRQAAKAQSMSPTSFGVSDLAELIVRRIVADVNSVNCKVSVHVSTGEAENLIATAIDNLSQSSTKAQIILSGDSDLFCFSYNTHALVYLMAADPCAQALLQSDWRQVMPTFEIFNMQKVQRSLFRSRFSSNMGVPVEPNEKKLSSWLKPGKDQPLNFHMHELINVYHDRGCAVVYLPSFPIADEPMGWNAGQEFRKEAWRLTFNLYFRNKNCTQVPTDRKIHLVERRAENYTCNAIPYEIDLDDVAQLKLDQKSVVEYLATIGSKDLNEAKERYDHIKTLINTAVGWNNENVPPKTSKDSVKVGTSDDTSYRRVLISLYSIMLLKSIKIDGLEWFPEDMPWRVDSADFCLDGTPEGLNLDKLSLN